MPHSLLLQKNKEEGHPPCKNKNYDREKQQAKEEEKIEGGGR
jgi:hypothetical protein